MLLRLLAFDPAGQQGALDHIVVHRLDAIAWGVLAAALAAKWPDRWRQMRWPALMLGLVLVGLCYTSSVEAEPLRSAWAKTLHLAGSSVGLALILPCAATVTAIRPAWWLRAVERIARWSYSMYLTNLLIAGVLFDCMARMRPDAGLGERLVWMEGYCMGTIAISAGLYRCIEAPVLAWRKHLRSTRHSHRRRA
jgi:peptidoglycan/LPS O-acetylase OafA/YrhL